MKKFFWLIAPLISMTQVHAEVNVVNGQDGRIDVYQTRNTLLRRLTRANAGMVNIASFLSTTSKGSADLNPRTTQTLAKGANICSTEAFANQYTAATCSGFLVGPDTIVTAGHCYRSFAPPETVCANFVWVFDYEMTSATSNPTKNIPLNNIYGCKQVLGSQFDDNSDFAVIKLDRPVAGREPLKFRLSGQVSKSANLVVIGHPSGLPTKITLGGKIIDNTGARTFVTNLDTFHGNSGSAVIDVSTGLVEGILTSGKTDYTPSDARDPRSCQVVNVCREDGSNCVSETDTDPKGETVFRITSIASDLKNVIKK